MDVCFKAKWSWALQYTVGASGFCGFQFERLEAHGFQCHDEDIGCRSKFLYYQDPLHPVVWSSSSGVSQHVFGVMGCMSCGLDICLPQTLNP